LQKPDAGAALPFQATADEDAEPMLTLRDQVNQHASTEPEEIDLDANVATMSYARNMWRGEPVADSLVMLPERYSQLARDSNAGTLKQKRFHSWDTYFGQGAALMRETPRRYESNVVKSFVEGLYATRQRGQCEQWLDLNGWTWESVAAFGLSGTPLVPAGVNKLDSVDSVDGRKTKTTAKVSEKRDASNKIDGGTPAVRRKSHKATQQKDDLSAEENTSISGPRRSQRIKDLSQSSRNLNEPMTQGVDKYPRKKNQKQDNARRERVWQRPRNEKGRFDKLPSPSKHEQLPSTPVRQRTPDRHEQALPRLVKRKRSTGAVHCESPKKRRLMDEEGLPPLPVQPSERVGRRVAKVRRRRSPLPPPPEIPIMPTSDD
jgi:hypothetical protein